MWKTLAMAGCVAVGVFVVLEVTVNARASFSEETEKSAAVIVTGSSDESFEAEEIAPIVSEPMEFDPLADKTVDELLMQRQSVEAELRYQANANLGLYDAPLSIHNLGIISLYANMIVVSDGSKVVFCGLATVRRDYKYFWLVYEFTPTTEMDVTDWGFAYHSPPYQGEDCRKAS